MMQMAQEVGSKENAESYVESVTSNRGRIPGFGHPVYQDLDPRSVHLKADAKALGARLEREAASLALNEIRKT